MIYLSNAPFTLEGEMRILVSSDVNFSSKPALMRETATAQSFGYEVWKFDDVDDVTNQYRTNASQFLVEMVFRWR